MESSLYSLWKVNIENLVQNKVELVKNFYIQPSEIDALPMWEYEKYIELINEYVKRENEQHEEQKKMYDTKFKQPSMPKMPKVPGIKY